MCGRSIETPPWEWCSAPVIAGPYLASARLIGTTVARRWRPVWMKIMYATYLITGKTGHRRLIHRRHVTAWRLWQWPINHCAWFVGRIWDEGFAFFFCFLYFFFFFFCNTIEGEKRRSVPMKSNDVRTGDKWK